GRRPAGAARRHREGRPPLQPGTARGLQPGRAGVPGVGVSAQPKSACPSRYRRVASSPPRSPWRGSRRMPRIVVPSVLVALLAAHSIHAEDFKLAPAVALEAEDFQVESGWKVVKNGEGNYMVDALGFNHI